MLAAAKRPILYVGAGVPRHNLTEAIIRLAERHALPVVTDLLGKAAFPESHIRLKSVLSPSPPVGEGWGGGWQAPQFLVG